MSALSDEDVIERIERLASAVSDAVVTPDLDIGRRSADLNHRSTSTRRWLVGTAVAVALVGCGAVWTMLDSDGSVVRTAEQDDVERHADIPEERLDVLVPTRWPAGLDEPGPATLQGPLEEMRERTVPDSESVLLDLRGTATAVAFTANYPAGVSNVVGSEATEVDGRQSWWLADPTGANRLIVSLAPGRSMTVSSYTAHRDDLEQVARDLAEADGVASSARFTGGWELDDDPLGVARLLTGSGRFGEGWANVSRRNAAGTGRSLSVWSHTDADADRAIADLTGLAGSKVRDPGELGIVHGVGLPVMNGDPDRTTELLAWVPEPGMLAVAVGTEVDWPEIVAAARSSRSLPPEEWRESHPPVPRRSTTEVEGFVIPSRSTVVDSGEDFGVTWLVTRESLPAGHVTHSVWYRDDRGQDGGGGGGGSGGIGLGFSRGSERVVYSASLPTGSTDVIIERLGHPVETAMVPLADEDFYFAILPAREIGEPPGLTVTVRATLPDGTPFVSPRN